MISYQKIVSDKNGFTALELIVVAGIMAFLMILTLANFHGFGQKSALDSEADKIASVLRQAQIWALTGQTSNNDRYAYGVHLSTCASGNCSYILFKDNETTGNKLYNAGEEIITYVIPTGVFFENVVPNVSGAADIVFLAPLGLVYINGSTGADESIIVLKHITGSQKSVIVNRVSGQINIQ